MSTAETIAPPLLNEVDRLLAQPWFETSGLDERSPEWAVVWAALVSAKYACASGFILWPKETNELLTGEAPDAHRVATALAAGALYADGSRHATSGDVDVNAGVGVEVMLGLLDRRPDLFEPELGGSLQERVDHLVSAAAGCVVGVFTDASAALATLISSLRGDPWFSEYSSQTWPPLVHLLTEEAVRDDVFAEHIIVQLGATETYNLDYFLLPSGNWLLFHPS